MSKIRVTVNGVKNLLLKQNPKKALGPDLVPTRALRDYADEIAPVLQTIFQQSLDTGDVPDDWRKANVAAIYKKGDRHVALNYRPVSHTCVSCKIFTFVFWIPTQIHLFSPLTSMILSCSLLGQCMSSVANTTDHDLAALAARKCWAQSTKRTENMYIGMQRYL